MNGIPSIQVNLANYFQKLFNHLILLLFIQFLIFYLFKGRKKKLDKGTNNTIGLGIFSFWKNN